MSEHVLGEVRAFVFSQVEKCLPCSLSAEPELALLFSETSTAMAYVWLCNGVHQFVWESVTPVTKHLLRYPCLGNIAFSAFCLGQCYDACPPSERLRKQLDMSRTYTRLLQPPKCEPLYLWTILNHRPLCHAKVVQALVEMLKLGVFQCCVDDEDELRDRPCCFQINFSVFGVLGSFVAQEPIPDMLDFLECCT